VRPPRRPDHHDDATRSCSSDCSVGIAAKDSFRVDHGSSRHRCIRRHLDRSAGHRPSSRAAPPGIVHSPHGHIVDHNWCSDHDGGPDHDSTPDHDDAPSYDSAPDHHDRHRSTEHDGSAYDDNGSTAVNHNIYATGHDDHDSKRFDHPQHRAAECLGSTRPGL